MAVKKNPWLVAVKLYQNQHNCSYKDAMVGAKKTYRKGQKGGDIFDDIKSGFKMLTQPKRIIKALKNPIAREMINPFNKKHGVVASVKAFTDKDNPKYKELHDYTRPLFEKAQSVAGFDKTGITSAILNKADTVGSGKRKKPKANGKRKK